MKMSDIRNAVILGTLIGLIFGLLLGGLIAVIEENAKNADSEAEKVQFQPIPNEDDNIIERNEIAVKTPEIGFVCKKTHEVGNGKSETEESVTEAEASEAEAEETEAQECELPELPHIKVNGELLPIELQELLYKELAKNGIEWIFEVAMIQMYQESRFNEYATHINGEDSVDYGLYQFNSKWLPENLIGKDVFDTGLQIEAYCKNMAERLRTGEGLTTAVSDHFTGGQYYDQNYVNDVYQWVNKIEYID